MDFHFNLSMIKSGIRILGLLLIGIGFVGAGLVSLITAEVVGIIEEF